MGEPNLKVNRALGPLKGLQLIFGSIKIYHALTTNM